jgi:hypothetical protein
MSPAFRLIAIGTIVCCLASSLHAENATDRSGFSVFPRVIALWGPEASMPVLVQRSRGEGVGEQIPVGSFSLRVLDGSIAEIIDGRIVPKSNGSTEILVTAEGFDGQARVPVIVRQLDRPWRWQFDAHVQAILSRQGCNSGACHGALAGKGGFRLSLRAYDSPADHFTMTRQDRGRRIEPAEPGRSLLLLKPSGQVPHKGGLRLEEGSSDYRALAEWISSGSPGPQPADARLAGIEVLPSEQQLVAGSRQQLLVLAHYEDGRVEDVTKWAKYSSSNEAVAQVDEDGLVTVLGRGKGAIVVWFASRLALGSLVVPAAQVATAEQYADFAPNNLIDEILLDEWRGQGLVPASSCDEATFLRRASLTATGTIPAPDAVRAFLQDTRPDKRQRLVDDLLAGNAYVDYWSYQWSDLLLVNSNLLRPNAVAAFYKWIRSQVESNTPWDEFARSIVLAKGDSFDQGATNFYAIHQDPESLTENTCQAFMGLSIGCAKCHNHPLEKWTNDQYYAMANLFARVRAKGWGGDARNGDGQRTLVVLERGDLIQPSRGEPQAPAPLDAAPIDIDSPEDRRVVLAQWLTSANNPYFARAIVNRVWANYMGAGLVESVDDLRVSNPASSERLLDALAEYLVEHNYDLKALMRLIMTSRTFQLSTNPQAGSEQDKRFYSHYLPRRLMAEVLHDAVVSVTEVPTSFKEIEFLGADRSATDFYPQGTQALALYDSAVANYFLKTFGRHQRRITCDCERSDQPTVVQVLHLNNGDTLNDKLTAAESITAKWLEREWTDEQLIEEAYLKCLGRYPTVEEGQRLAQALVATLADGASRREAIDDLVWSLMTSTEFLFLH